MDMEALEALLRKLLKNNSLRDTVKIATDSLGIPRSTVYERALIVRDATEKVKDRNSICH